MKKFILGLIFALIGVIGVNAQGYTVDTGKAFDNVYVGGQIGANVWNSADSWTFFTKKSDNWRVLPTGKIFVGKRFTPYVGAELDYTAEFRRYGVFLDQQYLGVNGVANLSNIIGKYKDERRFCEVELIAGPGWYHNYNTHYNGVYVKGAVRVNLAVAKNLDIAITPEYTYLAKGFGVPNYLHNVNLFVGVKYNIPTKRGGFKKILNYNCGEVLELNNKISELQAALTKKPEIVEIIKTESSIVKVPTAHKLYFEQGSTIVLGDVYAVANDIKAANKTVIITGYTSPEGSEKVNAELGQLRAEAVRNALINAGVDSTLLLINQSYDDLRTVTIELGE